MAASHPSVVPVKAYIATSPTSGLSEGVIKRRELRETDVSIKILYCGICHSDLHLLRNEWKDWPSTYPMVPGHEIVGVVDAVGSKVTKFRVGQNVGVGCIVNSCNTCDHCHKSLENYCSNGFTMTYASEDKISGGYTYGGYSERIVVEDRYVLNIPDGLDLAGASPLLCAGITAYSPLVDAGVGPGKKVGILGIGGLGHMGIKLARALGAHVVGFTSKAAKKEELFNLGAHDVVITSNPEDIKRVANSLDVLIDTVSADHDIASILGTLVFEGTYTVIGAPDAPMKVPIMPLLFKKVKLSGSAIGGIQRTQEMLDLCAKHGITAQIEIGQLKDVNQLLERLHAGDVRYRFVLDIKSAYGN